MRVVTEIKAKTCFTRINQEVSGTKKTTKILTFEGYARNVETRGRKRKNVLGESVETKPWGAPLPKKGGKENVRSE